MNNDLISKSAFIEALNNFLAEIGSNVLYGEDVINLINDSSLIDYSQIKSVTVELSEEDSARIKELSTQPTSQIVRRVDDTNWIPVSERLPQEKFNPYTHDFQEVLCVTTFGDVRTYKYGTAIGDNKAHFYHGGWNVDNYILAWQYFPEPYKEDINGTD